MHQLRIDMRFVYMLVISSFLFVIVGCSSAVKKPEIILTTPKVSAPNLTGLHQAEYNEALSLMKANNLDKAVSIFKRLISVYPNLAGAFVNLAFIHNAKSEQDKAENYFKSALEINPKNTDALLGLATARQKNGNFKEAERFLLTAEASDKKNTDVQFNLAVLYELYLQQYDDAIEHYENYIALTSNEDKETVKRWVKLLERK